ncbi:glycerol dehydrogenase [Proteus vulgaris]|uniref:glycerol dehydrogenase n=1 Tax=Proteus vulgaris TaxID=585 RepID=UPI0018C64730|nr:glycerol dehydrogenase [Proteus vulgaris]MBG2709427.1 glycerol dehydrogenase [Proteus mirabilis]MBG2767151.1 glycerol dehydrogenase [Proteus mirabilis]GLX64273.1 glycerol dehydrogenase [Proteus vulgaris]
MLKVIQSPSKYIQGPDALYHLGKYAKPFGDRALIIADKFVMELVGSTVKDSMSQYEVNGHFELFNGECTHNEINRLSELAKAQASLVIIGVGGGKTLDTAKAVAYKCQLPVVISPTIASTDAPTSALSVIYTELGAFDSYLFYPTNPDVVVMDTNIIASAPARLLVAGMGDALATYFEARACNHAQKQTMAGGKSTLAALALAELCYNTLLEDGYKAKLAVSRGVCTTAVENIIEANTFLSGIGFESAGLAAAHAIHNGFTALEECHNMYHGEKVAFGTLVQLVLENSPLEELEEFLDFCILVGLPVTLEELGINATGDELNEKIMAVAELSCAEGETIYNMPFDIDSDKVYAAILTADQLGREWLY